LEKKFDQKTGKNKPLKRLMGIFSPPFFYFLNLGVFHALKESSEGILVIWTVFVFSYPMVRTALNKFWLVSLVMHKPFMQCNTKWQHILLSLSLGYVNWAFYNPLARAKSPITNPLSRN
jgi:hypothetical protein